MSVFLITGENSYAANEELNRLKQEFLAQNTEDGLTERQSVGLQPEDMPTLLSGGSLFSSQRMVIIHDPGQNKDLNEPLASAVGKVPDEVQLVLVEAKPDKRGRWYKEAIKHGKVITKTLLREPEAARWLEELARERGCKITPADARYLVERVGSNQWRLSNELFKLIHFDTNVTRRSIDKLVEPSLKETIFQLLDYVVKGSTTKAHDLYEKLLLKDLDPHQFMAMMGWQLHRLLLVKTNTSMSTGQLSSEVGLPPFAVNRLKELAGGLSLSQIKHMIDLTINCEAKLTRTRADASRQAGLLINQIGKVAKASK